MAGKICERGNHINELQSLFRNCEKELQCLDMRINAKKIMLSAHWPKI